MSDRKRDNLFTRLKKSIRRKQKVAELKRRSPYHYTVYYQRNPDQELARLCDHYGADKGTNHNGPKPYSGSAHSYSDFISNRFEHRRHQTKKVMECGIGYRTPEQAVTGGEHGKSGPSLRVWRDYFPNARVYGVDVDERTFFSDDRISCHYVDQTSQESVKKMWEEINDTGFDLIIDDGLHKFQAGICLFENSIDRLSQDGLYIIEDVSINALLDFQAYFKDKPYKVEIINLYRPNLPLGDNSLVVIEKI